MPKLACNYSEALMGLINNGRTEIDFIKTGAYGAYEEKIPKMRAVKPVLLHGMGYDERAGMTDAGVVDFNRVNRLLKYCGSIHYGFHLAITNADMPDTLNNDEIYARMCGNVQLFKKNIPLPLLLENVPDTPEDRTDFDHYPYAEPEKINKIIIENDVYLLLDLTHAGVTAEYRGWDIYGYLNALPLDRVREIHCNGAGRDGSGNPTDPHRPMADADYKLLEWTLNRTKPDAMTLEYSGVKGESFDEITDNLLKQLDELNKILPRRRA